MVYSLSERGEAPRFLSKLNSARVPVVAVSVSVAFGFLAAVLELLFPDQILPALFQLVGSTCLVVWGSAPAIAAPHEEQNFAPNGFGCPRWGQLTSAIGLALDELAVVSCGEQLGDL